MRRSAVLLGLVCLCATVAVAQNQGKVDNGWSCSPPAEAKSIEVGDQPGHAYTVDQIKCTSTKGEYAGVREKEGTGTEFIEVKGDNATGHGIIVETMANGDTVYFTFQLTATMKDGKLESATDKWQATSGTGKFKGIKASGSCSGKSTADGSTNWTCTGTYTLPK
jgi:hypothetical protein